MKKSDASNVLTEGPPSVAAPQSAGFHSQGLQRIGDIFASDVQTGKIPGAVVYVARKGHIAYFEAFGSRDSEKRIPMRRDSIFRIASMTKPMVAAAALMLMEEGRLTLIEPVERYLPEFKDMQVGVESVDAGGERRLLLEPARRPITVQDLLRHTSGLTTGLFGDSLVKRMYHESKLRDDQQTSAEVIVKLGRLPLAYQPGTTFDYSMSTDVVGRLIEVIAGMDLNRFIIERIAQPLGMADTAFLLSEENLQRLALPQTDPAGGVKSILPPYDPSRPPKWFSGGAGLLSTAADYARFCQMLLNGGELQGVRLLSRKGIELMISDHLPPGTAFGPNTRDLGMPAPLPELGQSYGLGVGVRTHQGRSAVPGSVGDFFWGGALGTYFWADPREQLIGILMLQELDAAKRARYRSVFRNLVYHALGD